MKTIVRPDGEGGRGHNVRVAVVPLIVSIRLARLVEVLFPGAAADGVGALHLDPAVAILRRELRT